MRRLLAATAFIVGAPGLFALSFGDLTSVLDPSVTLSTLSSAAASGGALPGEGRFVVLTGVVQSIQVLDKSKGSFRAEIELVEGRWNGTTSISLFRCIVEIAGPEFFGRVPPQPSPPEGDPRAILTDERILVIGKVVGSRAYPDGSRIPVVDGSYVRAI